ncbi:hypothetical protein EZV62_013139 [Acer yangbiense]|uniref:BRCT domain-containing protein n=1 Tax=Acer yangbiense TaxID=1000413 RepID=A0A5C7HZG0_9ROSI|nr:hypothetical protein EZV62_013139 [Acer yangbiense]
MSPASTSSVASESVVVRSNGPFSGLVICVTGLSKGILGSIVVVTLMVEYELLIFVLIVLAEARRQVMEASERLGGVIFLLLRCFLTLFYSFGGRKLEHALKHGSRNGLFVVTLGWFVDSVRKNVRLSESLYTVKSFGEHGMHLDKLNRLVGFTGSENSCLPAGIYESKQYDKTGKPNLQFSDKDSNRSPGPALSGHYMYVDSDISEELRNKVFEAAAKEGATLVNQWFVGCSASHVVCEGTSVRRYLGHSNNLVTPLWVLKTAKEKYVQRLIHMSADLARQVGMMLENLSDGIAREEINGGNVSQDVQSCRSKAGHGERQEIVNLAKHGVRNRRGRRMQASILSDYTWCTSSICLCILLFLQTCQTPIRPLTPSSLLDSICWSISEPTSTTSIYTDSFSSDDVSEHHSSVFFDAKGDGKDSEASFANLTRLLTESEKSELIFKNHFLTILFPVDRFAEMGPSSRTFFSDNGFTCLQVLDYIYAFYQENMSAHEVESAIHTDSRHADRLRAVYSSKETTEHGYVTFKRIEFLGSRRSFEMLKRVSGDNNSNVYELLLRA